MKEKAALSSIDKNTLIDYMRRIDVDEQLAFNELTAYEQQILVENKASVKVGMCFFCSERLYKITKIVRHDDDTEPYHTLFTIVRRHDGTWSNSSNVNIAEFAKRYAKNSFGGDIENLLKDAKSIIDGKKSIEDYRDTTMDVDSNNSLLHVGSKDSLKTAQDNLQEMVRDAEAIERAVYHLMAVEKDRIMQIKWQLDAIIKDLERKVKKVQTFIDTIELYMGVNEDIIQIQEGEKMPEGTKITFRQEVLCMDEEVGDPTDDGLDFRNIEDFDQWLCNYSKYYKMHNYELIAPESICIIAIKVRRHEKRYSDNPFVNVSMNMQNENTYILIRNGTCLYRIWGEIRVWPRLFPYKAELQEYKDEWDKIDAYQVNKYGENYEKTNEQDSIDEKVFTYKRQLVLLQGLLDRTQIFGDYSRKIKLFDNAVFENGLVQFVYDNENLLDDGHMPYATWRANANRELRGGDRVFYNAEVAKDHIGRDEEHWSDRYNKTYQEGRWFNGKSYYNLPEKPQSAVYQVEWYTSEEWVADRAIANNVDELPDYVKKSYQEHAINDPERYPWSYSVKDERGYTQGSMQIVAHTAIKYNPGDTLYDASSWFAKSYTRKNRVSFKIYHDDAFILNIDNVSIEELDFYLYDRRHRRQYVVMMPMLYGIREQLVKERDQEAAFAKMLISELRANGWNKPHDTEEFLVATIQEAITWWKTKNTWKRALDTDDTKALRMIRKKLWLPTK